MTWRLLGRVDQWAQWIETATAPGWRARCLEVLAAATDVPQDANTGNWPRQRDWCRDAAQALSGMALSLNLPFPSFRPVAEAMKARDKGTAQGGVWYGEAGDQQTTLAAGDINQLVLYERIRFDAAGTITTDLNAASVPEGLIRCIDDTYNDCSMPGRGATGWTCASWSVCRPGWGPGGTDLAFLVPMRWQFEMLREALQRIASYASIGDMVDDSRVWIEQENAATIDAVAQIDPSVRSLGDVVSWQAEQRIARLRPSEQTQSLADLGSVPDAIVPHNPVTAAIKGAASIPSFLEQIFGRAVAQRVDYYGRNWPTLETSMISGQYSPPRPPSHVVPTPPQTATDASLTVSVPVTLYFPATSVVDYAQSSSSGASGESGVRVTELQQNSTGDESSGGWVWAAAAAAVVFLLTKGSGR